MARPISKLAPGWWDYTTLEPEILQDAASLTPDDLLTLSRDGFEVHFYDTLEEFYCAQAMEYIQTWQGASADDPLGICGPVGPIKQLPLVAMMVNALDIELRHAHFWGMDEWVEGGVPVSVEHPLSFARADRELLLDRIRPELRMPEANIHFPLDMGAYARSFEDARCLLMQGGQGDVLHWAFNEPPKREEPHLHEPPSPAEYRQLGARITELHPLTVAQNARASSGGYTPLVPTMAITVGPIETWKTDCVSIWLPGRLSTPFELRLTAFMIGKKISDTSVPMSLLADHPNVRFNYYRGNIGTVQTK